MKFPTPRTFDTAHARRHPEDKGNLVLVITRHRSNRDVYVGVAVFPSAPVSGTIQDHTYFEDVDEEVADLKKQLFACDLLSAPGS